MLTTAIITGGKLPFYIHAILMLIDELIFELQTESDANEELQCTYLFPKAVMIR